MIEQYTSYNMPPSAVVDLILSKVGPFDNYIIMCVDNNSYSALVRDPLGNVIQYDVVRYQAQYYNNWSITSTSSPGFDYTVHNEYYVISNIGLGTMEVPPSVSYVESWAMMGIVCFCAVMCVFPYIARRLFK